MTTAELNKLKQMSDEEIVKYLYEKLDTIKKEAIEYDRTISFEGKPFDVYVPTESTLKAAIDSLNDLNQSFKENIHTITHFSPYAYKKLRRIDRLFKWALEAIKLSEKLYGKYDIYKFKKMSPEEVLEALTKEYFILPKKTRVITYMGQPLEITEKKTKAEHNKELEMIKEWIADFNSLLFTLGFADVLRGSLFSGCFSSISFIPLYKKLQMQRLQRSDGYFRESYVPDREAHAKYAREYNAKNVLKRSFHQQNSQKKAAERYRIAQLVGVVHVCKSLTTDSTAA